MTINMNNLIEEFILGNLKGKKKVDFQNAMDGSPELALEVAFNTSLSESIRETDVMDLRSNLQSIMQFGSKKNDDKNSVFDLAQNLKQVKVSDYPNDISDQTENTLQFIHIENHKKSQTERKHQVPLGNKNENVSNFKLLSDEELWKEISYSIQETDVIDLRNNLKQIISMGNTEISDFEVDQFLDNDLPEEMMTTFRNMMEEDSSINRQIKLHQEIDEAISETDIRSLRNSLNELIEEEQMISYSEIKRIDDYLMSYLESKEQIEFEELLEENSRLFSEVHLNNEINESILEQDVMNLRASLDNVINGDKKDTKIRQLIPSRFNTKTSKLVGAAASVAAVISVGAMTMSQEKTSAEELYKKAYKPYEATGLYRSAVSVTPEMVGIDFYNEQNYTGALGKFKEVLNGNPEHPMCNFYSGLCFQQLGDYEKAITAFQKVIDEQDNLFVEQAEWYKALSQLQTKDLKKAYQSFNLIVNNKGYYSNDAKEILKKLK